MDDKVCTVTLDPHTYLEYAAWNAEQNYVSEAQTDPRDVHNSWFSRNTRKMNRRRFTKLLRGAGITETGIQRVIGRCKERGIPYIEAWCGMRDHMLRRIFRAERGAVESAMKAYISKHAGEEDNRLLGIVQAALNKDFVMAEYDDFKSLIESHPECTDCPSTTKAVRNAILSAAKPDKNGRLVVSSSLVSAEMINQYSRIHSWYWFVEERMNGLA